MTASSPGGDPRFSVRPGSLDPNADFYATPRRGATPGPAGAGGPASPFGAPASPFGAPASPFGAPASPFSAPGSPFGAPAVRGAAPGAQAPAAPLPGRTPLPTWGKVLIGLGCALGAVSTAGVVASVAIPVVLHQRAQAADERVQADLRAVAGAQEAFWNAHGTYAPDPGALGVAEPASEVAVLFADAGWYCLGGRDPGGRGSVWYVSSVSAVPSTTPCA
ncbi:type IV pilin protein [Kineococcus arenarius]|uniref:type IV pilin protein n=1 Tax=unclassified Kineococcus TaxID=2621656 RepID=UPI003D7EA4D4